MARPRKEESERRTINYTVRLTEDQLRKLVILSQQMGVTPAVLIRDKVFKGKFPEPKAPKIDVDTYLELKKSGGNLNQLTRKVNMGQLPDDLLPVLERLEQQQAEIIAMLFHGSQSAHY